MTALAKPGSFALLCCFVILVAIKAAWAGMDVSLDREFLRLQDIQQRMESLPAYRQSEEVRQQIISLQRRIEELAPRAPEVIETERRNLQKEMDELHAKLQDLQKIIADFREQTSRGERQRFFPGVRHRIAAFTFDDPHDTGLGDAILFLLSKKLLFSARVPSFAIVSYRQGVERRAADELAYFDRVDAITQDQKFLLAVWGRISRTETGVRIQSFLQVPADADGPPFVQKVRLPEAMGGGALTARLKPSRIMVQSLDIGLDQVQALKKAAADVAVVRTKPSVSARAAGRLKEGIPYRIVDSRQDWVRLRFKNGSGWTSIDRFCTEACRDLLDVAKFTNDIIALISGAPGRPVPSSLTPEADAVARQLAALRLLANDPRKAKEAMPSNGVVANAPSLESAGFANLLAVARVAAELRHMSAIQPDFDRIQLDRHFLDRVTRDLAKASVAAPADIDIVDNLATLFDALGDEKRRGLALEIAANLRRR
jgi:hypothetical protein